MVIASLSAWQGIAVGLVAGAAIGVQIGRAEMLFMWRLATRRARLLAWRRKYRGRGPLRRLARAYRVLWADCARLVSTGRWT